MSCKECHAEVDELFKFHKTNKDQSERMGRIGGLAKKLCHEIMDKAPASADRTHAIRLIKDATMWINGAISREVQDVRQPGKPETYGMEREGEGGKSESRFDSPLVYDNADLAKKIVDVACAGAVPTNCGPTDHAFVSSGGCLIFCQKCGQIRDLSASRAEETTPVGGTGEVYT